MSVGKRTSVKQMTLWVPSNLVPDAPGHPFYERLNAIFKAEGFDAWAEKACEPYFKHGGRPSIPPGVYFRMLLVGYFENIPSERGIAWRCSDSRALGRFLGYEIHESTPDHSTLSVWRNRLPVKLFKAVFLRMLRLAAKNGLVSGATLGVDSSTLEANAAMKSIVRRDCGDNYKEYIDNLIRESWGIEPAAEDRIRFDRKRKKSLSNKDWESKSDPDAKIAKMKDGTTHLAYKAENAVDLESSVIVEARVTPADEMDTETILATVDGASKNLHKIDRNKNVLNVVADKGYHSVKNVKELAWDRDITTFIPERKVNGRRHWDGDARARAAFHANRQRCRGERGKAMGRKRANLVERAFAHLLQTGGMGRVTVRGRENVEKRYLMAAVAYNLGVVMRKLYGKGTPRGMAERRLLAFYALILWILLLHLINPDD